MTLFDRYIAVDWSASNTPKRGRDSIWIGELGPEGRVASENPPTRDEAMASITRRLLGALERGERVMLGCDFVFGYPRGASEAIAGVANWRAVWRYLAAHVVDEPDNRSNRFAVAETINLRQASGPHFWGHPHQHSYVGLWPRRSADAYETFPERRLAEGFVRTAQPVWKLTGVGSVGSQTLLGIARLEALRNDPRLAAHIAVWPFETDFAAKLDKSIAVIEIYPSMFPVGEADGLPRDRAQVEVATARFAQLDRDGLLRQFLSAPAALSAEDREAVLTEEGWIAGAGQEVLLSQQRSAA